MQVYLLWRNDRTESSHDADTLLGVYDSFESAVNDARVFSGQVNMRFVLPLELGARTDCWFSADDSDGFYDSFRINREHVRVCYL